MAANPESFDHFLRGEPVPATQPEADTSSFNHFLRGEPFPFYVKVGGASTQNITLSSGISSAEAFGSPTITTGAVTVAPSGIASAEAFGTPTISIGAITLSPTGIASAEAFGTPAITTGAVTITPTGISSAEAFGTATLSVGAVTIAPSGIASDEAFGTPTLSVGAVTVQPSGIASAEAFGTASISTGAATIAPSSISSSEAFGSPTITTGAVTVSPTGIASAESFGTALVNTNLDYVYPVGIVSLEGVGTPTISIVSTASVSFRETLPASYITAKNTLHSIAPWVWLIQADRDGTNAIRLAGYDTAIVYGGNTYSAFPIGLSGIVRDLQGNRQPLEVTVSNVSREIGGLLEDGEFVGRSVRVLLVLSTDLTTAQDWGTWVVKAARVGLNAATFALGLPGDAGAQVPARRIHRGRCDFRYGDFECGYVTSLPNAISGTNPLFDPTTCDLTLEGANGCRVHGDNEVANGRGRLHPLLHGGFPSIPRGPARV